MVAPSDAHRVFILGVTRPSVVVQTGLIPALPQGGARDLLGLPVHLRTIVDEHHTALMQEQAVRPDDLRKGNRLCLERPIERMARVLNCTARKFPRPASRILMSHYCDQPSVPGLHFPRPYLYILPVRHTVTTDPRSREEDAVKLRRVIVTPYPAVFQGPEIPHDVTRHPALVTLLVKKEALIPAVYTKDFRVPSSDPIPYEIKGAVQSEPMAPPPGPVPATGPRKRPATNLTRPQAVKRPRIGPVITKPPKLPGTSATSRQATSTGRGRGRGRGAVVSRPSADATSEAPGPPRRVSTRSTTPTVSNAEINPTTVPTGDGDPPAAGAAGESSSTTRPVRTIKAAYQGQALAHKRKSTARKPLSFPQETLGSDAPGTSGGGGPVPAGQVQQRRKQRRTASSVPYDPDTKRWAPFRSVRVDPESMLATSRLPKGRAHEAETFGDTFVAAELDYVPTTFSAHTYYADVPKPLGARVHVLNQPQEFAPINAEEVGVEGFRLPVAAPPRPLTKHRNHLASAHVIPFCEDATAARQELFEHRIGLAVFGHPICIFIYSMFQISHTLRLPLRTTWLEQTITDHCERELTDSAAVALVDALFGPQVDAQLAHLSHRHSWTLILRAGISEGEAVIFCYIRVEALFRHHVLFLCTLPSATLKRADGRQEVTPKRLIPIIERRVALDLKMDLSRCLTVHYNLHSLHWTTLVKIGNRWDMLHSDNLPALFGYQSGGSLAQRVDLLHDGSARV